VLHGAQPLGDDDLGGLGYETFEACADELVGLGVDGTRGVIEDEYLGFLEQCPGDVQKREVEARASLLKGEEEEEGRINDLDHGTGTGFVDNLLSAFIKRALDVKEISK